MTALIVMACSSTKRPGEEAMPAIDRYDGPMWRTLRAALADLGEDCRPEIWFLSARYGFHPADMPIADYEQRMTPSRAAELLRLPTSNHAAFAEAARGADRILLAGGAIYRDAMRRAIGSCANWCAARSAGWTRSADALKSALSTNSPATAFSNPAKLFEWSFPHRKQGDSALNRPS